MNNQEKLAYYGAKVIDAWILEKRARECGEIEIANDLESSRKYYESQANLAKQEIEGENVNENL